MAQFKASLSFKDRYALQQLLKLKWSHIQSNPQDFYPTFVDCCHSLNIKAPSRRTANRYIVDFGLPALPRPTRPKRLTPEGQAALQVNMAKARAARSAQLAATRSPSPALSSDLTPVLSRIADALEALATAPTPPRFREFLKTLVDSHINENSDPDLMANHIQSTRVQAQLLLNEK